MDKGKSFMHVKYRVLTHAEGIQDPQYDKYVEYLNTIGLKYEVQAIGDSWDRDEYCWYFDTPEQALQFKLYSNGRLL